MFRRLVQWLKSFFQRLFGGKPNASQVKRDVQREPAPPLSDTDLEFLFNELLEGVHQVRGQAWAQKWLHNIEHRISTERWVEWLRRLGERLLASPAPNNELAARLVQLGDLGVGEVGDTAYEIGMQLLTRNQGEAVWEYEGPDAVGETFLPQEGFSVAEETDGEENSPEGDYQTVSLEDLFVMLQQDESLCQQMAEQLALDTNDPEVIVQALINQFYAANESTTEESLKDEV
ncbi:hypothetical protein [Calothrix sp. PCC 7507]|uniref:hypothetical protein n=1 Tax=Calothrix sp. PCC 7507 TaxID=99598 RepID=UPI00029F44E6|nr:hypothetical protein [Calothrix sp. PCC 7507]AFY31879.1 hypothetical protein Cal7507_1413 [Calothrix sp. PCC 7507]